MQQKNKFLGIFLSWGKEHITAPVAITPPYLGPHPASSHH
jgi:hypothetical protein